MSRGIHVSLGVLGAFAVFTSISLMAYCFLLGALTHDWSVLKAFENGEYLAPAFHFRTHSSVKLPGLCAALAAGIGALFGLGFLVFLLKPKEHRGAAFMTAVDLKRMGFFSSNTMLLGRFGGLATSRRFRVRSEATGEVEFVEKRKLVGGRYVHSPYFGHVFVSGPTRSGKGASLIIPNALEFRGSMVILDIRGETYDNTASYRANFSKIFKFAPATRFSHGYNPLDFIRKESGFRESDIMNCATGLVASPGLKEEYWIKDARELVAGVISYTLESNHVSKRSISTVMEIVLGRQYVIEQLRSIVDKEAAELSAFTVSKFNAILAMGEKQFAGVYGELRQSMRAFTNEFVQRATDVSSFDLRKFRKESHTVYLDFRLSQIQIMTGIANVMLTQLINFLSDERMQTGEHRIMLMLDEFTTLGKIEPLIPMMKVLAGNGVSVWTFVQSFTDVEAIYDRTGRNTILDNSEAFVFLGGESPDVLEYLERQMGKKIETRRTKRTNSKFLPQHSGLNEEREVEVPLMARDQLRLLPRTDAIILPRAQNPIIVRRNYFFADKRMAKVASNGPSKILIPDLANQSPPNVFRSKPVPRAALDSSVVHSEASAPERIKPGFVFQQAAKATGTSPSAVAVKTSPSTVEPTLHTVSSSFHELSRTSAAPGATSDPSDERKGPAPALRLAPPSPPKRSGVWRPAKTPGKASTQGRAAIAVPKSPSWDSLGVAEDDLLRFRVAQQSDKELSALTRELLSSLTTVPAGRKGSEAHYQSLVKVNSAIRSLEPPRGWRSKQPN